MTTLIISILAIIVIIGIIIRRFSNVRNSSTYSWFEILNPFDSSPIQIYKHLSSENKGAFWSVTASVIIGVISCWLGFSVQFLVLNSSQTESDKLAHYEVVDKFRPKYLAVFDSITTSVIEKMTTPLGYMSDDKVEFTTDDYMYYYKNKKFPENKINTPEAQLASFVLNEDNWSSIIYTGKKIVEVSSEIAPYLDYKKNQELLNNNTIILSGIQLYELANDSIELDSATVVQKCISQLVNAGVLHKSSYQTNWAQICSAQYSLYKEMRAQESSFRCKALAVAINSIILQPMTKNLLTIQASFSPVESLNTIAYGSFCILLISIFIGYLLMRAVVMKFFNAKSMKPNPQLSQSEYEKNIRRMNSAEKEINQYKVNEISLLKTIDNFKHELSDKYNLIEKLQSELETTKQLMAEQNEQLVKKMMIVQSENEELKQTIENISSTSKEIDNDN